jgi:hypothetical protein
VLVNGLQVGQELFDTLAGHLAGDWTVITYDQRDQGDTTAPAGPYTADNTPRSTRRSAGPSVTHHRGEHDSRENRR